MKHLIGTTAFALVMLLGTSIVDAKGNAAVSNDQIYTDPFQDNEDVPDGPAAGCLRVCWTEWKPVCRDANGYTSMGWRQWCLYPDCTRSVSKWYCGQKN